MCVHLYMYTLISLSLYIYIYVYVYIYIYVLISAYMIISTYIGVNVYINTYSCALSSSKPQGPHFVNISLSRRDVPKGRPHDGLYKASGTTLC